MYFFQFYQPLHPAYILHSNFLLFHSSWNRHFIFLLNFCSYSLSSLEINILLPPLSLEIPKPSLWDDPVVFTFLKVCLLYLLFALLIQHNYILPCVVKKILVCVWGVVAGGACILPLGQILGSQRTQMDFKIFYVPQRLRMSYHVNHLQTILYPRKQITLIEERVVLELRIPEFPFNQLCQFSHLRSLAKLFNNMKLLFCLPHSLLWCLVKYRACRPILGINVYWKMKLLWLFGNWSATLFLSFIGA